MHANQLDWPKATFWVVFHLCPIFSITWNIAGKFVASGPKLQPSCGLRKKRVGGSKKERQRQGPFLVAGNGGKETRKDVGNES